MKKRQLDFCEFYITNVCNLTCTNCNRFNNYNVKGRVEFDYDLYKPWADKVEFGHIGIIGGEPLLHPNLKSWVEGIHALWPNSPILVTSNGTQVNKHPDLFDLLRKNNATLEISFHEQKVDDYIWKEIEKFKRHGTNWTESHGEYHMKDRDGNEISIPTYTLTCDEGFRFEFTDAHVFQRIQIKEWIDGNPIHYDVDPKQAHYVCGMKNSHTFYEGKLYKCGFIPSVKNFLQQFGYNEWDKVYQYTPHTDVNDFDTRLKCPEDVCSVCPDHYVFDNVKTNFK